MRSLFSAVLVCVSVFQPFVLGLVRNTQQGALSSKHLPDLRTTTRRVQTSKRGGPQVLEKDKRDAEELVRGLQAKVAKLGGGEGGENGGADDSDRGGTGGSEVEVLQRELSLTLTDLAKVSTEVRDVVDA